MHFTNYFDTLSKNAHIRFTNRKLIIFAVTKKRASITKLFIDHEKSTHLGYPDSKLDTDG